MSGIHKEVKDLRFKKVKDRQVRKFNNLLNKKGREYNLAKHS